MTAALVAAVIGAIAVAAILAATLFWQLKRGAKSVDLALKSPEKIAELRILNAAAHVALNDKERTMNIAIAERDRLEFTLDTVEDQRDELLKEALKNATPGTIAIAVRDALNKLRAFPPKQSEAEGVPDVPSGEDSNGH